MTCTRGRCKLGQGAASEPLATARPMAQWRGRVPLSAQHRAGLRRGPQTARTLLPGAQGAGPHAAPVRIVWEGVLDTMLRDSGLFSLERGPGPGPSGPGGDLTLRTQPQSPPSADAGLDNEPEPAGSPGAAHPAQGAPASFHSAKRPRGSSVV